jgi:hypothetical protein
VTRTRLCPAALEAGAVVGQHALDGDPVSAVEADDLVEECEGRVGGLVGVDRREAEPGAIVDRHEQVLPACPAGGSHRAIAGDAVAGLDDPSELLDVDVHELSGSRALVADDLLASDWDTETRAAVAMQHRVHGGGSHSERPADHVRSFA